MLFGVTITVIAYVAALNLQQRLPWLHPLFSATGALMLFLWLADIPYESYKTSGDVISFFLGPATVALAVPLYKQAANLRARWRGIVLGIAVGSVSGMLVAAGLMLLAGGTQQLLVTMLPKSATTPISMELARHLGGIPPLAAVFTVITGLIGSMIGQRMLSLCGIRDPYAVGAAIGTAAHGIGTARLLRDRELEGAISGFAMGLTGILISLLLIPF